ncbi:hypothetical protein GCM10009837_84530 [Streptomyces durmitorensis]|uniref:Vegetative cell wall protein gp1 n=1 Tax=Streptomyces durmitorensis TaxID=319947 RepID=A0ABY4PNV1_9ACTN|nr:hypothetical protein [Streptomyces durmitorensis]UQT54726.1 hypothetical protein M4V62_06255 [Streptomyces durmitorensis]
MSELWTELSKQLADRWLSLLVLPGLLFLGVAAAAHTLGNQHPFDAELLVRTITAEAKNPVVTGTSGQILLLVAVLLAAAAAGVVAQAIGVFVERVVLASGWTAWPVPAAWLVRRWVCLRRLRWDHADRLYDGELQRALLPDPADRPDPAVRQAAAGRRARIAPERPERPTWTGDRIQAAVLRLDRDHHVDLAVVWPALERVLPDGLCGDIANARAAMARAVTLAGWAVLYAFLTWWWWPGALIAVVLASAARLRMRAGADQYARLLETAGRLYVPTLASTLGIDHTGPLDRELGTAVTEQLRTESPRPGPADEPARRWWMWWYRGVS